MQEIEKFLASIIIIVYYARRQHIKYRKQNTPTQ